ncbi:MAG: glycosyltransferase family 4 protein [Solirubrobacteraceae bacterium]
MKIQLWSYNYDPEPTGIGPVSTTLACALHARGHEIDVIAAHPHYPAPEWGRRVLPYRERRDSIDVLRLPLWVGRGTAFQRYRQELTFMAALSAALPTMRRADISIVASPSFPALLPAMIAHRARNTPWVLWLNDILPDGATATGLIREGSVALRGARRLEREAYARTTLIVALSEAFRENLLMKNVPDRKIRVIYDPATRAPNGRVPCTAESLRHSSPWRLLSMGNIGFSQGLAPLVEAFEARDRAGSGDVRLLITGVGVAASEVASKIRDDRVQMLGMLTDDALEHELRDATLALVSQHHSGTEFNIPSRIMNFMAYGLPIVAAVNPASEVAKIVKESNGGWVVDSSDPASFPEKLAELRAKPEEVALRGAAALRYAHEHFTVPAFAERFEDVLHDVLASGSRAR